jgi:hypothetical protein
VPVPARARRVRIGVADQVRIDQSDLFSTPHNEGLHFDSECFRACDARGNIDVRGSGKEFQARYAGAGCRASCAPVRVRAACVLELLTHFAHDPG